MSGSSKIRLLHPLHKKGDTRECTNYRGIASLNADAKLFEQALLHILNDFIDEIDYIGDTQFGFTSGLSTVDALLVARTIAATARENEVPLYKCYIDLKKAYDRIHRATLWEILRRLGLPGAILNCIIGLYDGAEATVQAAGITSGTPIKLSNGLITLCAPL